MPVGPVSEGIPLIRMDRVIDDAATPSIRQRARLASLLEGLDAAQWSAPSRCRGWSVKDVIAHLITVNQFWTLSIKAGAAGSPTRYLEKFDPVATPAQLVEAERGATPSEILDRFLVANDGLNTVLSSLDADDWSKMAEAPPGHLAIRLVVLHGLWDSWIHERDIVLPLGLTHVLEPDEVIGSLVYVSGLGAAFRVMRGSQRNGIVEVRGAQPHIRFLVDIGKTVLLRQGPCPDGGPKVDADAVELIEALSARAPFPAAIEPDDRRFIDGLTTVFAGDF